MSCTLTRIRLRSLLDAAFENVADVELPPDLLGVDRLALVGEGGVARDDERVGDPRQVGRQALGDAVDEMLLLRAAAEIGEGQDHDREARRAGPFRRRLERNRLRLGGHADLERIDPDRLGDVLQFLEAEIADRQVEPPLDLAIGVFRERDRAGPGDALEPGGDVDAVAHQVAVGLLDDVAEMDADAKLDAAVGRQAGVALDEPVLHLDGAAHRIDDAAEFDQHAVAGAFDDAPVVNGDDGIDQVAAERAQPRQDSIFVGARKP